MIRIGLAAALLATVFVVPTDAAERATVNFCSGADGGAYLQAAEIIAGSVQGVPLKVYRTHGSVENMERIFKGDCDLAIVQSDVIGTWMDQRPETARVIDRAGTIFKEYVHLICNNDSKISSIKDLKEADNKGDGGTAVAIGSPGSGASATWEAFTTANPRYQKVPTVRSGEEVALSKVSDGTDTTCMITVSALNTSFLKRSVGRAGDHVHLVQVNDGALEKLKDDRKRPVYVWTEIPGGTYPEIQHGWFSTAVTTVSVDAVIVARRAWMDKDMNQYNALLRGLNAAKPKLLAKFGG